MRKLKYNGTAGMTTGDTYDPEFAVTFQGLISSKRSLEKQTAEGKLTLVMAHADGDGSFVYTISGLKTNGKMLIDGIEKEGEWEYHVVEEKVRGYETEYSAAGILPDFSQRTSVKDGGTISNTQILGTLIVEKKTAGLSTERLSGKHFRVTVQREMPGDEKDHYYLKTDGTLSETEQIYPVASDGKLYFRNVLPGTYRVTELGTDAGGASQGGGAGTDTDITALVTGYTLSVTNDAENPSDGTGWQYDVKVANGDTVRSAITNTYSLDLTQTQFEKVWLPLASDEDPDTPVEWPDSEEITIEVHRRSGNDTDSGFCLTYTGKKGANGIIWTADSIVRPDEDTGTLNITESTADSVYAFTISGLTEKILGGDGSDWVYYVTETKTGANYRTGYGSIPYQDAPGGGESSEPASGTDENHPAIINRQDKISVTVIKEWYELGQTTPVPWPKDGSGTDIPIAFTVTGTKAGEENRVRTYSGLIAAAPDEQSSYRLTRIGNRYIFEFTGLDPDCRYTIAEGAVSGYYAEYWNAAEGGLFEKNTVSSVSPGGLVKNSQAVYELPATGGPGRMRICLTGFVFAALADVVPVLPKKESLI